MILTSRAKTRQHKENVNAFGEFVNEQDFRLTLQPYSGLMETS